MSESIEIVGKSEPKKDFYGRPGVWRDNVYLPTAPVLDTHEKQQEFIEILTDKRYLSLACKEFGICTRSVQRMMTKNPQFAEAVGLIRQMHEDTVLIDLEIISETQAKLPKNTTERIFQLNALDSAKYRPKQVNIAATSVHVTIGWAPPALREKGKKEVQADYAIGGNNKGKTP